MARIVSCTDVLSQPAMQSCSGRAATAESAVELGEAALGIAVRVTDEGPAAPAVAAEAGGAEA
ncbi:MAG: hypothetical protein EXR68_04110 [Dehalococcoidia bacterium]|nr:hypothetical protein [Dehalococcoidia bacterium]